MRSLALIAAVLVAACASTPAPLPPEPDIVIVYPADPCPEACRRLSELGCPEGDQTPDGTSCEVICRNAGDLVDAPCVTRARSRADLQACNVRCIQ